MLRKGTGIQWPCTDQHPHGVERLYVDGRFNTDPDFCETYGYDIATGAPKTPTEYRALEPHGRAFLYGVEFEPGPETTDDEYPTLLTTGRTVYQFHTRTKTGRAPQLDAAAPDAWVEISVHDATALAISEGDLVRVRVGTGLRRDQGTHHRHTPRGRVRSLPLRHLEIRTRHVTGGQAASRERTDPVRLGSGLEAADLQGRCGQDQQSRLR